MSDLSDYYSVILRAVNGLALPTSAARQEAYQRARYALVNQLRSSQPPVPETNIAIERRALDEAITLVEAQFDVKPPEPAAAPPPIAPPPAAPPPVAPRAAVAPKRGNFRRVLLIAVFAGAIGFELHANLPLVVQLAESSLTQAFGKRDATVEEAERSASPQPPGDADSGREAEPKSAAVKAGSPTNAPDRASNAPAEAQPSDPPRTQASARPETPQEAAERGVSAPIQVQPPAQPPSRALSGCEADPQCAAWTGVDVADPADAPTAPAGGRDASEHRAVPAKPDRNAGSQPSEPLPPQASVTPADASLKDAEQGLSAPQSQTAKIAADKAKPKKKPPLPPKRDDSLTRPEPTLLDVLLRGFRGGDSQ